MHFVIKSCQIIIMNLIIFLNLSHFAFQQICSRLCFWSKLFWFIQLIRSVLDIINIKIVDVSSIVEKKNNTSYYNYLFWDLEFWDFKLSDIILLELTLWFLLLAIINYFLGCITDDAEVEFLYSLETILVYYFDYC